MQQKTRLTFLQITIIGAIIRSVILRFYGLGIQSFWIDEGFSSFVSMISLDGGTVFSYPYRLHTISQILSFKVFGLSDFSARFPSVIYNILNFFIIYGISQIIWKDKRISRCAVILFAFSQREIIWARQARFYSLLQLLFSCNILLLLQYVYKKNKFYLNAFLISSYISILFHPFLYMNVLFAVIIGVRYIILHHKTITISSIFTKYQSAFLIVGLIIIHQIIEHFMPRGITTSVFIESDLTNAMKWNYFKGYLSHIIEEVGFGIVVTVVGLWYLIKNKKRYEVLIFGGGIVGLLFILSFRGYLMHFRYILIAYPLIFILIAHGFVHIIDSQKEYIMKIIFGGVTIRALLVTGKFQFIPQNTYMIDYTSPQPNFKAIYEAIPDNQKVVSGFPVLCKRYYANRGECIGALNVDIIFDNKTISKGEREFYTKLPYFTSLSIIQEIDHYVVLDNLSFKGLHGNPTILSEISGYISVINTGQNYNNIVLYKK